MSKPSGVLLLCLAILILPAGVRSAGKPIVAIFDMECSSRVKLTAEVRDNLADYIASRLTESGQFMVVPRDQLRQRLVQEKSRSYKECFDQSCQIEIGRELAAEKTLATKIVKLGNRCTVTLTLYDLKLSTTEAAATQHGGCDEQGVVEAVDGALTKLFGEQPAKKPAPVAQPTPPAKAPEPVVERPAPALESPVRAVSPTEAWVPTRDSATVLLDNFDGTTAGQVLAYREDGAKCGQRKPAAPANLGYVPGRMGYGQALLMGPPQGAPTGSATYLQYPGGQVLSSQAGTIEFQLYLDSYSTGLALAEQGQFYGACMGWTFGLGVDKDGRLSASAWDAFSMDSGARKVPLHRWVQVAATWGPAGAKLYLDGDLVGSSTNTGRPAPFFNGQLMLRLGTHAGVTARIDALRVSNIQRTVFK